MNKLVDARAMLSGPGSIPLPRATRPVAKASALAYLHMGRPDLSKASAFLEDFGLVQAASGADCVYYRGTGTHPFIYKVTRTKQPCFIGFGLTVEDEASLAALARHFGAAIDTNGDPGGGVVLRITDPDGHRIDVLHGQAPVAKLPMRGAIKHNAPGETVRVNAAQRPKLAPPEVSKLGHIVLATPHFARNARWYMESFGFIPSDVLCLPDGTPAGAFMRLDRGPVPSDHHTLFVALGAAPGIDHAAFEVADLDAVEMGQQVLRARGYRHSWGVGRHLLGSQIFDYWRDPWLMKHEHYADGDLFDADQPTFYHKLDRQGLYQWGPDLPEDFVDPGLTPVAVARLLWHAARGEVALAPLLAAARSMRAPGRAWQKR
jgi:hypothetical protein